MMENWEYQRIRKEAASQAIYVTIGMVEDALGVPFPRGQTPSESRELMLNILGSMLKRM